MKTMQKETRAMDANLLNIIGVLAVFALIVIVPLAFVFGIYTFNKRKRK